MADLAVPSLSVPPSVETCNASVFVPQEGHYCNIFENR
ncbi:hypothetical protein A2U01_0053430, partial [Trifolium medium]|nr:hypothetical protein [Trifolium medium]